MQRSEISASNGVPEKMLVLQQRGDGQGDMAVVCTGLGKLRSLQRQASRDEHEKSRNAGNAAGGQPIGTTKSFLEPRNWVKTVIYS